MKLKMLETQHGSPDGVAVVMYLKDEVVEMPDDLGEVFVKEKWAVPVNKKKDSGAVPENKSKGKNKK